MTSFFDSIWNDVASVSKENVSAKDTITTRGAYIIIGEVCVISKVSKADLVTSRAKTQNQYYDYIPRESDK